MQNEFESNQKKQGVMKMITNNGCRIAEDGSICSIDIYTKNGELYCSYSGVEIKDFNIEYRSNSTALFFSMEG